MREKGAFRKKVPVFPSVFHSILRPSPRISFILTDADRGGIQDLQKGPGRKIHLEILSTILSGLFLGAVSYNFKYGI